MRVAGTAGTGGTSVLSRNSWLALLCDDERRKKEKLPRRRCSEVTEAASLACPERVSFNGSGGDLGADALGWGYATGGRGGGR